MCNRVHTRISVYINVYSCIYTCIRVHMCIRVRTSVSLCIYVYPYEYTCIRVHTHASVYTHVYTCTTVHAHVSVFTNVTVYTLVCLYECARLYVHVSKCCNIIAVYDCTYVCLYECARLCEHIIAVYVIPDVRLTVEFLYKADECIPTNTKAKEKELQNTLCPSTSSDPCQYEFDSFCVAKSYLYDQKVGKYFVLYLYFKHVLKYGVVSAKYLQTPFTSTTYWHYARSLIPRQPVQLPY